MFAHFVVLVTVWISTDQENASHYDGCPSDSDLTKSRVESMREQTVLTSVDADVMNQVMMPVKPSRKSMNSVSSRIRHHLTIESGKKKVSPSDCLHEQVTYDGRILMVGKKRKIHFRVNDN